jgi:hypothetical protein
MPICLGEEENLVYGANSLKQNSMGGHVVPLRYIIPILIQLFFAFNTQYCVLKY